MSNLNDHNQRYYQKNGTTTVPDLLATARPIQEALRQEIESLIPANPIRVLELGFGSRLHRYEHIAATTTRIWQVTLTDFSRQVLPQNLPPSPKISYKTLALNLLTDPLPKGPWDIILSTYVFDSIDFPTDTYEHNHHLPKGLIAIAQKAQKELSQNGRFITIDKYAQKAAVALKEPAAGAFFKTLDLEYAAAAIPGNLILLEDFLASHHQSLPLNLSDHALIVVSPK